MKLYVKRVTLTGASTPITFPKYAKAFLVKNFSDDDMFVNFEAVTDEDEAVKIPANVAEEIYLDDPVRLPFATSVNTIYVKGTGEVEVRELWLDT